MNRLPRLVPRIDDLVGKRYRTGGRGPDFYDCAGLFVEVQARFGRPLKIPKTPRDERRQVRTMLRILAAEWREIKHPEPGCCVFWMGDGHVGTMLDARRFLHTTSEFGWSFIEGLDAPQWRGKKAMFYVPKEATA